MALTDTDYNAFARGLVRNFVARTLGTDDTGARIVGRNPPDHVLTGFLTPARQPDPASDDDDDLPTDRAYEQSSLGLEWHFRENSLRDGAFATVAVNLNVYVRRLPLFEELAALTWRRQDDGSELAVVPRVWTRENLGPLEVTVQLAALLETRSMQIPLDGRVLQNYANVATTGLFPGRRPLALRREDVASRQGYERWVGSLRPAAADCVWRPVLDVRATTSPAYPGHVRTALRVVNRSQPIRPPQSDFIDANIYAVTIRVVLPAQAHVPTEFRELQDSYRYDRSMAAVGINSHATSQSHDADDTLVLTAHPVPQREVPRLVPRNVPDAPPEFMRLALDPCPVLRCIARDMRRFLEEEWAEKLARLAGSELREGEAARSEFECELGRFERGIELLENPKYALVHRAFSLMNRAMGANAWARGYREWHLFQIIFVVSALPGLASREYVELDDGRELETVDILWFSAGGGKTEAFLGLIIWQAFFDRLRGKTLGVTAFVRFPLRMLGFQQFNRIAHALAAAELLRQSEGLRGARFSLGFLVGRQVTPNTIDDDQHARLVRSGPDPRLRRILRCPFCQVAFGRGPSEGSAIELRYDEETRRIEHWCTDDNCPGGRERLPFYIVDRDVHRYLPTAVISTVDKLAQLGQNQRFSNLLGRISFVCSRHGATFAGAEHKSCAASAALGRGETPEACGGDRLIHGPFHDLAPALCIQDEMHLLSEDVGVFDAHYETALFELARSLSARPWKIICATATIEDYREHAWQLYLRQSRRFPGPGPSANDSFYYRQATDRIGRIFVGLLGVGRKHTPIVSRALTMLYLELQAARELFATDRERAFNRYGTRVLAVNEWRDLIFRYELPLTYVLTRKGSDQIAETIESRVKTELQALTPEHGDLLVKTFNSGVDISDMIETIDAIQRATPEGSPSDRTRGIVATNIIGHGVDVDRFNIMLFAGFTRLIAEYIQASARVGRTFPGISILAVTPQSERDRSIFDRFSKFHEYVDRLVDPTAVNRWSESALQRTVPGLLCGYLMGVVASHVGKALSTVEQVLRVVGDPGADALNQEPLAEWMLRAYGVSGGRSPSPRYMEQVRAHALRLRSLVVNAQSTGGRPRTLNTFLPAMQSLRDVDEPASVRVGEPRHVTALRNLLRG